MPAETFRHLHQHLLRPMPEKWRALAGDSDAVGKREGVGGNVGHSGERERAEGKGGTKFQTPSPYVKTPGR
jgi:hypothetical protein